MENTTNCTVYEIFSGVRNGDDLQNAKVIGKGKIFEGEKYYVLRLKYFPQTCFYLVKDKQMGNWADLDIALHYGEIMNSRARDALDKASRKLKLVKAEDGLEGAG